VRLAANSTTVTIKELNGESIATVAASAQPQRVSFAMILNPVTTETSSCDAGAVEKIRRPPLAGARPPRPPQLATLQQNGLILDKIATPDENPWKRRVRVADLGFLTDDRVAVLGYDGDVWIVDGFADASLAKLTWRRFASGLHEAAQHGDCEGRHHSSRDEERRGARSTIVMATAKRTGSKISTTSCSRARRRGRFRSAWASGPTAPRIFRRVAS